MSNTTTTGMKKSFTATSEVLAYRVLQLDQYANVEYASDVSGGYLIGASDRQAAAGEVLPVALSGAGGSAFCEAAEAIGLGENVYVSTGGKVATGVTAQHDVLVGYALEAATVDGDVIEVLFA